MLEPFSTLGIGLVGYAALHAYAYRSSAISPEAQAARKAASAVVEFAERSQVLFGTKRIAISHIEALANECADAGWDGNEAAPLDSTAARTATEFIRAMPDDSRVLPME